ncbi:MAG: ATP-binding protein [Thermodesulfobacteriota bacterium]|nr:ATP-binding protein [Thermodesulfobacteriota bacterium]
MKKNPFYLKEIPVNAPFCDREKELADLISYAKSNINVVLFSPRRYGKTSITKRVQNSLKSDGTLTAYCDLFGVTSVEEIAGRIARSIYTVTHKNQGMFQKAIGFITSFRPVLSPSPEGGISVSVQTAFKTDGLKILEDTMESLEKFIIDVGLPVHVAFDEFQEIAEVHNSIGIEGILRQYIQKIQCSFFFIGSRRRILLDIFNDRKRPFFQSSLNYELKPLPHKDMVLFITSEFKRAGKYINEEDASEICQLVSNHPYYMQKFCFFLYEEINKEVKQKDIAEIKAIVVESERVVFESILQGLRTKQINILSALAKEPTAKIYSASYMARHNLGSTGGIQQGLNTLSRKDLIEKDYRTGVWSVVDPIFVCWFIEMSL